MKFLSLCSVAGAGLLGASMLASAQPAFSQANPLACARTTAGEEILVGSPVRDADGRSLGAVSLSQCTAEASSGELRVWLDPSIGSEVRAFPLSMVRLDGGSVVLDVTREEVAASEAERSKSAKAQAEEG